MSVSHFHHFQPALILSQCLCSSALLHRTSFRFQLDKLLGHLVSRPLGQDTHHCHARLVGLNARPQRTPAHAALAVSDVTQLNHGHADHTVRPAETVILHRHLELIAVWRLLTKDTTEQKRTLKNQPLIQQSSQHIPAVRDQVSNSQLERLVELCRPAVVLGFCGELALLVGQEGTNHGDFNERPEHPRCLPLHVVRCDDWMERSWKTGEREGEHMRQIEIQSWMYDYVFVVACVYIYTEQKYKSNAFVFAPIFHKFK